MVRRVLLAALLLLCSGCARQIPAWHADSVLAGQSGYSSSRLLCPLGGEGMGVELEIIHTADTLVGYVNLTEPLSSQTKEVAMALEIEGRDEKFFHAIVRQGGGRICLPEEAVAELLCALHAHESCTLVCGKRRMVVPQEGFEVSAEVLEERSALFKFWRQCYRSLVPSLERPG